jgi:hypothetical protein
VNKVLAVAAIIVTAATALPAHAEGRYQSVDGRHRDDDWGRGWGHNKHKQHHHRHGPSHFGPPMVIYRSAPPTTVYMMPPPPIQAVPMSPMYTDSWGRYCREYQSTVTVGGLPQGGYGTACMQPDGSWQVMR